MASIEFQMQVRGIERLERLLDWAHGSEWRALLAVVIFKLTGFIFYRVRGITRWYVIYVGNMAHIVISFRNRDVISW